MNHTEFGERLCAALAISKPDLTSAEVDRRTHGIAPGRYLLVEHAIRVVHELVAAADHLERESASEATP